MKYLEQTLYFLKRWYISFSYTFNEFRSSSNWTWTYVMILDSQTRLDVNFGDIYFVMGRYGAACGKKVISDTRIWGTFNARPTLDWIIISFCFRTADDLMCWQIALVFTSHSALVPGTINYNVCSYLKQLCRGSAMLICCHGALLNNFLI